MCKKMSSEHSNALSLLSIYNSDSESETPETNSSAKRCHSDENSTAKYIKIKNGKFPLPSIMQPVERNASEKQNDTHGGRIRTFPHERGNWSTYLFVKYEYQDAIQDLIKDLISKSNISIKLQPSDDLHISLTRTVVLRYHWIEPFMETIKNHLINIQDFIILFDNLKIYCNEERTRTFIGLQIRSGYDSLLSIVNILDCCLKEYDLPEFYKDPSFHMTLAWCVGDYETQLNSIISDLNEIVSDYMLIYSQNYWYIHVKQIAFKSGNRFFNFNLKSK